MAASTADPRLARVAAWFEGLTPATLPEIDALYAADAAFRDPFSDVRGVAAIRAVFAHMYTQVDEPRFVVHAAVAEGDTAFLTWTMQYRSRTGAREAQTIRGCTELRFAADGRIALHRDWWDAAEELYEKLPLLGALLRAIKRRLRA